ncbi:hypothetical protein PPL_11823 [Heterostelium album PN500]|uniref:Uncharacterized protein n=1 Tax=Heterostelium pallidum (strain ATCC 26659 / Pp 5 / PN500) TaxID=670386 RepID=D3BUK2_HETP5|nr:hypothetical protein PPL_11823 [Heterostelium album PN500]EFA74790.1 hypothetical protein PPL_11823 [Heterostelium album PN500]|eukprot:XP_020426924.1 hypothetical protein PPL_11823 [Heterostelium album PN500]
MSVDLNKVINTIKERELDKVIELYKDRNELINDLFSVLNSNFTQKNIVEDCFFILNEMISNTIWNDLTLTTKIELQSKSLDLLELECNHLNTITIEFINYLYHNHNHEINEYQSILQSISKRYIKHNNTEFRFTCLELICLILKSKVSTEEINEFESSLSNLITISFEQPNDNTLYFIKHFEIIKPNFPDLRIENETITTYLNNRFDDYIMSESYNTTVFSNFFEEIFELSDSNKLDDRIALVLLSNLISATEDEDVQIEEEFKDKYLHFIFKQFFKIDDTQVQRWDDQKQVCSSSGFPILCLNSIAFTYDKLLYQRFKELKDQVIQTGDWKQLCGLSTIASVTLKDYIDEYTYIGVYKWISEYFVHPEPYVRANYIELAVALIEQCEPTVEETITLLDNVLSLNDSHPPVQRGIFKLINTMIALENSKFKEKIDRVLEYCSKYMNIEQPNDIIEGVVGLIGGICGSMFESISKYANSYLSFMMSIIKSDRFNPHSHMFGIVLEAISVIILESHGSVDVGFKHSFETIEIIKRNMPPHTDETSGNYARSLVRFVQALKAKFQPHYEFLIHYLINTLDFQWDEIKQISQDELDSRHETIGLTIALIPLLTSEQQPSIQPYIGQLITQLYKMIDFGSVIIKEDSVRLLSLLFETTITHYQLTNLNNKSNTNNKHIETLRQSIISRLQQSIDMEEDEDVLEIKEEELENINYNTESKFPTCFYQSSKEFNIIYLFVKFKKKHATHNNPAMNNYSRSLVQFVQSLKSQFTLLSIFSISNHMKSRKSHEEHPSTYPYIGQFIPQLFKLLDCDSAIYPVHIREKLICGYLVYSFESINNTPPHFQIQNEH